MLRRYPPHRRTLWSLLESRAAARPRHECLVHGGLSVSYEEVLRRAKSAAAFYADRGVRAGDRIGVMSLNHPATVYTLLGLARLGATMVPVNPDFGREEARYVLAHAQVTGVLCSPEALPTVSSAVTAMDAVPWIVTNDAVLDAPEAPPDASRPDAIVLFIYTSGTTGFPKGAMHSQENVVLAGEGFVARMHLQPDERLLCILPLFHVNAIFYSLAGALAAGATLILQPRFSASAFWRTVAQTRATEVNTIAAVSNILMRRSREEFVPGHTLRKIYGGPFSEEVYRVFEREFGVPELVEGYGMTEIPGALNNPFGGPRKAGSMGKPSVHPDPAVKLSELKVVDDAGRELPDGEVGELVVRTPIVMKGYYRAPDQTAAAFRDGWFLTGDLARRDADGYFWFVARKKDIIRKRGENISGAELDRVVSEHPDVLEAAAIPVPSELGEDEILLAVVPRPGARPGAQSIAQWCRERLAAIKVPRFIAFVDSLPHTPTHRVAKFRLREDADLRARAIDLGP